VTEAAVQGRIRVSAPVLKAPGLIRGGGTSTLLLCDSAL
jgi:hypothetical protein